LANPSIYIKCFLTLTDALTLLAKEAQSSDLSGCRLECEMSMLQSRASLKCMENEICPTPSTLHERSGPAFAKQSQSGWLVARTTQCKMSSLLMYCDQTTLPSFPTLMLVLELADTSGAKCCLLIITQRKLPHLMSSSFRFAIVGSRRASLAQFRPD
jgi:hypothetical protein